METVGSLIDKLSINELKIYHMTEQKLRNDISKEFRNECEERLRILKMQKADLTDELQELADAVATGKKRMKVYRQLKMYNEKKYKD